MPDKQGSQAEADTEFFDILKSADTEDLQILAELIAIEALRIRQPAAAVP